MLAETLPFDSDVPLPRAKSRNIPLYPWLKMKSGDSFTVHGKIAASAARGSFRRYQKMGLISGNLTVMQRVADSGIRLWLVEKGETKCP